MNQVDLDKEVLKYYNYEDGVKPMYDGIINEEKYNAAKIKILWICKEPYDYDEGTGGWFLREQINEDFEGYFKIPILKRIAITSYCILNGCDYKTAVEKEDVASSLQSIAYINLNKIPATSSSSGREKVFEEIYNKCKPVLLEQINSFKPDVLIFGNVFYFFLEDLGFSWKNGKNLELQSRSIFYKDDQIFIDAYHPSVWPSIISAEDYCNSIANAVKTWLEVKK